MRRAAVVSLGGTIAMTKSESGLAHPSLDGNALVSSVPELANTASITVFSPFNMPSGHLTPENILELARFVDQLYESGFNGVVVTQGTDTMEESAYFLDLIVKAPVPVVLTGAQRNPSLPGPDGPANLYDAVLTAVDPKAKDFGTVVVFSSEIHSGREVIKTHTTRLDTFKSPEFGPLGVVNNGRVLWMRQPLIREHYDVQSLDARVEVIYVGMGTGPHLVDACIETGASGIILEAMGGGHVPPWLLPSIERAVNRGIPVVMTSRCHMGRLLTSTYGYPGSEADLRKIGVIFGDGLPVSKARVKLITLLGAGFSLEGIRHEFEKHFYE